MTLAALFLIKQLLWAYIIAMAAIVVVGILILIIILWWMGDEA